MEQELQFLFSELELPYRQKQSLWDIVTKKSNDKPIFYIEKLEKGSLELLALMGAFTLYILQTTLGKTLESAWEKSNLSQDLEKHILNAFNTLADYLPHRKKHISKNILPQYEGRIIGGHYIITKVIKNVINDKQVMVIEIEPLKDSMKFQPIVLTFLVALLIALGFSCRQQDKRVVEKRDAVKIENPSPKKETVVQKLAVLSPDSNIASLDLSHQNLKALPDLSKLTIQDLDLSFNQLDTIPLSHLPKNLRRLICTNNRLRNFKSYNYLGQAANKYHNSDLNLYEIDLSSNQLKTFLYTVKHKRNFLKNCNLQRVNLSNNNLTYVSVNCGNTKYLDISNNAGLSNIFDFEINKIDTVLRSNIKNNLPLELKKYPALMPIID